MIWIRCGSSTCGVSVPKSKFNSRTSRTGRSRNRKQLRPNELAEWELRVESFRIFYDVSVEDEVVKVVAVGIKDGNDLFIHGEKFRVMKTIDIPQVSSDVADLLEQARHEDLVVRLADGSEFLLIAVDDFDREIAKSRDNPRLMALLESRARQTATVPWDDVKRRFGL